MNQSGPVTGEIFTAFLKCRYKAHLKLRGEAGDKSDYELAQADLAIAYKAAATQMLLRKNAGQLVVQGPPSLEDALSSGAALIINATATGGAASCRIDALERDSSGTAAPYSPVLFVRREKITADDRLLLGFAASVLARVQGAEPAFGRIIHGKDFKASRVELDTLSDAVRDTVSQIQDIAGAVKPPPLMLNKHCGECEFRPRCRAESIEKDDLSLLGNLSAKELAALNARGIFTLTQYSYTFRPGRMKRAETKRHDSSLQALALREKTVYVAKRPELPAGKSVLYLDVEGLPDEGFHYLIGLTIAEGESRRHLSFWADSESEEAAIWSSFLEAAGAIEDFVLFHYGSYESKFLERMEGRHGGNAVVIGRIKKRSVNVLSLIYSRVYFPVHSNDLKSVAGCLGFRWSDAEASGLQSIVWRHHWEATRDDRLKKRLLTYNEEDCAALERLVQILRSLGGEVENQGNGTGLRVAGIEEVAAQSRHKFGTKKYALPEFARLTKCAYFDYQRDKVLCRTNPRIRSVSRKRKGTKRKALKVNREVQCGNPTVCSNCESTGLNYKSSYRKLVIDLKPTPGGLKRWVTAYSGRWYQCRKCGGSQAPVEYLAHASLKYGKGVHNWVAHSSISLRQTNEAVIQALDDLFGIPMSTTTVTNLRRRTAEHYRPTYEALLSALRGGPLVHADETKVKMKGPTGDGYVWAFASPDTAVYVYAATREGDTARRTLEGFKGVLVSDFYSAYDSLDCPQQKCLIHLIRDLNDDLLKNPFDEELKQQAARFTALLQAIIVTIDRYGLKKYHLHKHSKGVDCFFMVESGAVYRSEVAQYYRQRLLKYRAKLFTFLDYDGVPWNNNNAENAIKQFASRRKAIGAAFTESGIRDYLLLLSIYQTLRYRNASFWKFLLSGQTDIEAFTAKRR